MGLYENIKEIALLKNISIAQLERETKMSNGSISKWSKNAPSADKLSTVAKYLNVTTDYLLGHINDPNLNENDMATGEVIHALLSGDDRLLDLNKQIAKLSDKELGAIQVLIDSIVKDR